MSARLKSRRVPSRAIRLGYNLPAIKRHGHEKPRQYGDRDCRNAHEHLRQFTRREHRREAADQDREAYGEQEHKETEEPRDRTSFEKLCGAGENRGEEFVASDHSALMLSDFVELAALRGDGD